jgi:hypothetical protein
MSANQLNPEEWGRRLEAGDRSDPALRLAAQLVQNRPAAPRLDHTSRENLRRRLLRQADAAPAQRLGSLAASLAAMLLLATAVAIFWTSQAANQPILPGAADEDAAADAVALTLTDREGELADLELELRELEAAAASWQIAPLRQSAVDGDLLIDTTLTYDPAAPPPTITLLLGPASWRGGGVNQDEAVETAVLNPAEIAAAEGEIAVRFTVDPLAVWERFNDYELVLAAEIEYETADGAVVATTIERQLTLQVAWLDGLWLNSVTPEPGTPLDNASFTVELGYRLLSAPAADIRLLIAAPNWESASGDRLPVTGAAESIRVARGEGVLTFAFTSEDAAYLHNLLGDEATLAANMLASGDDGMMRALTQRTFGDYRWPIAAIERLPDRLWFVDIAPPPGTTIHEGDTAVVTLGYELHTAAEGFIYVAWSHAEWDGPNPPTTAFGSQTITAGTGQIELEFTADDLAALQSRAGQFVHLTAALGASDEQNQHRRLAEAAWEDAPWRLGDALIGVPRTPPQVVILDHDATGNATTRLAVLSVESSAETADGLTPIFFTVELAYGLAARIAEDAAVMIWIMPEQGGVSQVLVAETVQSGAGTLTATFNFNPQRDLDQNLRGPRRYQLMISLNRPDGSFFTNTTLPEFWEFRP